MRIAGPNVTAGGIGFGAIVLLGFSDGGYHASTWSWAGLGLAAVLGIRALSGQRLAPSRPELLTVAGLGGLGLWMLLSALWGIAGTEALREAERCALYALGVATFLVVVRPAASRTLLAGVVGGVGVLAAYALGHRLVSGPARDPFQGSLLVEPIGYANAMGALMAFGVVLASGMLERATGTLERVVLLAAGTVSAIALALTSSRGAWLATVVGVAVLALWPRDRPTARRRLIAVGFALAIGALAVVALGRASFGDRTAYWRVAIASVAERPLLGAGAGTFDDLWLEERSISADVRDAHSLYLETAAELGLVGLALLLVVLGMPLLATLRARLPRDAAAAGAAYAAFLVHAGLDWDWEVPVVTFAGLACGAALLVRTRERLVARDHGSRGRTNLR